MTFGPFSANAAVTGLNAYDAPTGGNLLHLGTINTPRIIGAGVELVFDTGQLTVSLA
jgi:hypothetical protein